MTFLGLERPVEYGREQVFDPTTAQMVLNANRDYINAVYNDYRQALADMKEFNKEYGDFLSPIQADMDWYEKNVSGRIRGFIDDLYNRGIDPLRSSEGRAAVTRELARLPIQQVAQKRQAAESAREYIKNRDALRKAGMWNEDYERAMLGGQLLEEWDNSLGPWKATSASPYMDYERKYGHLFDKMGFEYDPEESKKFPGMRAFTKSKDRMRDILSASRPDLINDPQYKYDLQRIMSANPGISSADASKLLENEIIERNYKGGMELKEDPIYMANLKYNRDLNLLRQRYGDKPRNKQDFSTTFMDRLWNDIDNDRDRKLFSLGNRGTSLNGILSYWDKMMESVKGKGKVIGEKEVDKPVSKGIVTPSPYGVFPSVGIAKTNIVTEKGKENVYDQSSNALYKQYAYEKARWANMINGNYYPSKYDTRKTEDGKNYIVPIINRIIKKGKNATPEELNLLKQYRNEDLNSMIMKASSSSPEWSGKGNQPKGTMAVRDAKKRASDYWDGFAAEGQGPIQNKVLHQQFVGSDNQIKDPDLPNGYYSVRFGNDYHYAPVRQLNVSGNARFKYNDIHSKFDRFIRGRYGVSINENDVKAAGIPYQDRYGRQLDILSHPLMSKEQIQQFFDSLSYKEKQKYKDINGLVRELGLLPTDQKTMYRGKDEELHSSDTYYEIPVIRTIDNSGGYKYRNINTLSNILEFNATIADKEQVNSENQSVIDGLPIELATQLLLSE